MNKLRFSWLRLSFLAVLLILGMVKAACGFEIGITVAPNVINIQSESTVVTVHTDIGYSTVYAHSLVLNGVPIQSWKMDNRGYFVAKFAMGAVKDALTPDYVNKLTLFGVTVKSLGSEAFIGTDEVWVVDNVPQGGGR